MSASVPSHDDNLQLIDLLLDEQQSLTLVERFAENHANTSRESTARFYSDLLPAAAPGAGEQYAFQVDLDQCTGCKACVTACQSLNGLDAHETWRDVGLILGDNAGEPVQQTVTTACHHCEDPACMAGCPVRAYEKDEATGIVRHLDDQCIGCQYCVLKCHYDVPKYDATRGIVRKCDMCTGRLSVGEPPACVQGCPNDAISITVVPRKQEAQHALLPVLPGTTPGSAITRPTTRFVTDRLRGLALAPVDQHTPRPNSGHTPLAFMMIAVQLALGLLIVDGLAGLYGVPGIEATRANWTLAAAIIAAVGQAGAFLHLGRPLYAFRAFLGWRTSWMSREIIALGPFVAFAGAYAASWHVATWLERFAGVELVVSVLPSLRLTMSALAITFGLLGTYCSVMIYSDTRRAFWSFGPTAVRFFGSAIVLGPAASLVIGADDATSVVALSQASIALCLASVAASWTKLGAELALFRHRNSSIHGALARSVQLIEGPLRNVFRARIVTAIAATVLLMGFATLQNELPAPIGAFVVGTAFALLLVGESLERNLFFRAEATAAMPGLS